MKSSRKDVVRTAILGAALLAIGLVLVAIGILPVDAALTVAQRVWPVLLFVIAITIVTQLAADAELFRVVAERAARWGHGRAWLLWIFVILLAIVSTVFLSIDTSAVLLTPVVVLLARHVGLPPLPFALTTVWLANTASLLLPVSNLTNLLAQHALGEIGPLAFAERMALPALISIVVPCLVLFVVFRRQLVARYEPDLATAPDDKILFTASAVVVCLLLPAFVTGIAVWIPTTIAAIVLLGFFVVRKRSAVRLTIVPWGVVLLASGLFLVVEAAHSHGLGMLLATVSGTGKDPLSLLQLAMVGVVGANAFDNLPAYFALEPVAHEPIRLAALLIGVNVGPLITPWAALATLLWHERLKALDVHISWRRYALLGIIVVPLTVFPAVLALST